MNSIASKGSDNGVQDAGILKLKRRKIDGYSKVGWPLSEGFTCSLYYPFSDGMNETCLFGQRNEVERQNHPTVRMLPSKQRLKARDTVFPQIVERLIEKKKLLIPDSQFQIPLECLIFTGSYVVARFIKAD